MNRCVNLPPFLSLLFSLSVEIGDLKKYTRVHVFTGFVVPPFESCLGFQLIPSLQGQCAGSKPLFIHNWLWWVHTWQAKNQNHTASYTLCLAPDLCWWSPTVWAKCVYTCPGNHLHQTECLRRKLWVRIPLAWQLENARGELTLTFRYPQSWFPFMPWQS